MNRLPIRVLAVPFIAASYILCPNPSVRPADASPPDSRYVQVWGDEFTVPPTSLDYTKWGYLKGGVGVTSYDVDGVKVQDGVVTLSIWTEGTPPIIQRGGWIQSGGYPGEFSPPGNKYLPRFGYIEARIKFEGKSGIYSSFFLQTPRNNNLTRPLDEHERGMEIDIVEHQVTDGANHDRSGQAPSNIHFMSYDSPTCSDCHPDDPRNWYHGGGQSHPGSALHSESDSLDIDFHTYGLEWTPDYLRVFYDDVLVWTVINSTEQHPLSTIPPPCVPGSLDCALVGPCSGQTISECVYGPVPNLFTLDPAGEFIILKPEVGGSAGYGPIPFDSLTGYPGYGPKGVATNAKMTVDYVRHYQLLVAPTNLTATAQSNGPINLTWTYNGLFPPDAFAIERSTDNVHFTYAAGLTGSTHQYQDAGLQVDTHYWYRVRANLGGAYSDAATASAITGPAPASVGDLTVFDVKKTNVALKWTAPGDDGTGESVVSYDLRYSLSPITASNFYSATHFGTLTPNVSGYQECRRVTGLQANKTYYFAIKAGDEVVNWSAISNVVSATTPSSGLNTEFANCPPPVSDGGPPADVTSLAVTCISSTQASVSWTAPGDDGNTGTAMEYNLRYSTFPITAANFGSAIHFPITVPNTAGTPESRPVTGLTACGTYYFALKTRDDLGNWSGISNVQNTTLPCSGICPGGEAANRPVPLDEALPLFSAPSPNPARGATSFRISVPAQGAKLRIGVFDVQGRRVRSLVDGAVSPGQVQIDWDLLDDSGQRVASGLYMMRVNVGDARKTFPLVVVR